VKILIVEDEPDIALGLEEDLKRHGYAVETVSDGESALARVGKEEWDLILLDVMLPGKDGFEVCEGMRHSDVRTPIIMLTAKTHEAEKVMGLDLGADDYVTKPFSPRELRSRINAVLRRTSEKSFGTYEFGNCEVDFDRVEVRRNGVSIDISAQEFRLLATFIRRRGRVLSRDQLIDAAWGQDVFVTDRVVDTHVWNLRKKIEPTPAEPRYICSVRGLGYRFDG
jgi:two-component system alkaline phosphatase synthesis response regulator PhoP